MPSALEGTPAIDQAQRTIGSPGQASAAAPPFAAGRILLLLAFLVVTSVITYRAASELNVLGNPNAHRFGLADFRDGVYYPVVSFLAGNNPYDPVTHRRTYPVYFPFPLYSPLTFVVHLPFGLLPFRVAGWLYFALTVAVIPCIAALTLRLCGVAATGTRVFGLATLILMSRPGHWNLFIGQFAATMVLAAYAALYFARSRPWLAAVGVALSTIKPTFALPLAVLMLARQDRRAVGIGLALAVVVTAFPAAILAQRAGGLGPFLHVLEDSHRAFSAEQEVNPASTPYRVDAPALVGRLLGTRSAGLGDAIVGLAVLGLGTLAVRRLARAGGTGARRVAASIACLTILACTYHQAYDLILLALPLTALASGQWGAPAPGSAPVRWALLALLALPAANYLASANAITSLHIAGRWWVAVASFNSGAVLLALLICAGSALRAPLVSPRADR